MRHLLLFLALPAFAQLPMLMFSGNFEYTGGSVSGNAAFRTPMPPIPLMVNAPYSAQEKIESGQDLPGGGHVSRPVRLDQKVWRDSQGRIRIEKTFVSNPAQVRNAPTLVQIQDPVAGIMIIMDDVNKVAHRMKVSVLPQKNLEELLLHGGPNASAPASDFQDLGMQTIEGVQAHVTRRTFVVPAGSRGNSAEIRSTRDYWYSPDLNMVIRTVTNDPRSGNTIEGAADLSRKEPDPALFVVPANYQLVDETAEFEIKWGK